MIPARRLMLVRISRQRGAVLAVSLALLLALTLLALATSRATRSQTDFAVSARERDIAFQAAEAALRAGERLLASTAPAPCAAERCQIYGPNQLEGGPAMQSAAWRQRRAWAYTSGNEWIPWSESVERARKADEAAAFVIEDYFDAPDSLAVSPESQASSVTTYRITAAAYTRSGRPVVVLQSTFNRTRVPGRDIEGDPGADPSTSAEAPLGRQSWRQLR